MTVGVPPSMPFAADPASRDARSDAESSTGSPARVRPRWLRWLWYTVAVLAASATVTGPWWGPPALATLDFFHVRTVEFDGVRFAKTAELMQRLNVDTTQSVWQSVDSLAARVAAHPMVARVDIERDLPATLRVHVTERIPVALVPAKGGLRPADATGALLPIDPSAIALDMPLAASADSALLTVLDGLRQNAPELYARVTEAKRVNADELRFVLTAGTTGAAGPAMMNAVVVRTGAEVTVARFRDILPVEADLARNHLRVVELDLRFRDQVIARQP